MARNRILLLSAICAISSGQPAMAAKHSCNTDRIRAEFNTSEGVPDLTGCKPDSIRPILSNYDYGLVVQNKVPSETIGSGRIVSQRVSDGYVYVDVSAGSNQSDHVGEKVAVGLVGAFIGAILAAPKKKPPPPEQPPAVEPTPPPVATGQPLAPTPVAPTPPPPPVVQPTPAPPPPPATPPQVAQVAKPPQPPVINKPPTEQPPAPPEDTSAPPQTTDTSDVIPPDPIPPPSPIPPIQPALFRLSIQGPTSVKEGDQLTLVIQRVRRDAIGHQVQLAYSNPAIFASPPETKFEFGAETPDKIDVQLPTVVMKDGGNHNLTVTLASTDRAQIAQPASVSAVILDSTWWVKLLQLLADLPVWARALAAAAATAVVGTATYFWFKPRATCSIEFAGVSLGGQPFNDHWPAVDVEVVIGEPTFSIPTPLPIRSSADAEPSPA